ncbi:MAG TPA: TRAP transporter small permease subunit [Candidatus Saccharimonadia bacterium]|nr:TRAP transporter small permease subunit [Candidatus Saccharimonadia bacterium]
MIRAAARGFFRALARLEDWLVAGLTAALVLLAGAQIVARLVFDSGWGSLEPALRAMVLWIALLGAMIASREDRHLAIDALSRFLGGGAARAVRAIVYLGAAGVTALLAWYSLALVRTEYESATIAFAHVPAWAIEAMMPFAFAAMTLRFVIHAFLPPRPESAPITPAAP